MTQSQTPLFRRHTIVVAGAFAADAARLSLARTRTAGTWVTSVEGLALRLAGGFLTGIDREALLDAVTATLTELPASLLGDLDSISELPGLPAALCGTFAHCWAAGRDLSHCTTKVSTTRLAALRRIEAAALAKLPLASRRPSELAALAIQRLTSAPSILGSVDFRAIADFDPCWRPLISALCTALPTRWMAGSRSIPRWVANTGCEIVTHAATRPEMSIASCASARHETIEALRWARSTLARGIPASDIAISAASPGEYDDLVFTLAAEANLDIHFAHGRRVLTRRDGQVCAALADLLLRGLDRDRMLRFVSTVRGGGTALGALPEHWRGFVGRGALLNEPERWRKALVLSEAPADVASPLLDAVGLIARGIDQAGIIGEALLSGASRQIWQRALRQAPASAIEASLADLRSPDQVDPANAIVWVQAAALAAAPRRHVWLLGLNSRSWPRRSREDPLLPDHLLPDAAARPRTVTEDDRASFAHILATTEHTITCSYSRRDATGRILGASPLLPKIEAKLLTRARTPEHAMSEPDRLMACPAEFAETRRAVAAEACWRDWHCEELTAHDGLVRPDHPAIITALAREHSASSLKMLLRNPLGFVWKYAFGWSAPDLVEATFDLDASSFGTFIHEVLRTATMALEAGVGLACARKEEVETAVGVAASEVAEFWAQNHPLPPALLWNGYVASARTLAFTALNLGIDPLSGQHSFVELDFPANDGAAPWIDQATDLNIPGTALRIKGRIDRLDLSGDGLSARVIDYKTGALRAPVALDGGKELQRSLYTYAMQALLGPRVAIEAALFFPRGGHEGYQPLEDQQHTLALLTQALVDAVNSLRNGAALPGPDSGVGYDDLAFALPGSAGFSLERKKQLAREHLGPASAIWEAE